MVHFNPWHQPELGCLQESGLQRIHCFDHSFLSFITWDYLLFLCPPRKSEYHRINFKNCLFYSQSSEHCWPWSHYRVDWPLLKALARFSSLRQPIYSFLIDSLKFQRYSSKFPSSWNSQVCSHASLSQKRHLWCKTQGWSTSWGWTEEN